MVPPSTSQTIHIIAIGDQSRLFYEKMLFFGMIHEHANTRFVIWENSKRPFLPFNIALERYMQRGSPVWHIFNITGLHMRGRIINDLKSRKTLDERLLKKLNIEFRDITEHLDRLPHKQFWKEQLESPLVWNHEDIYFYSILFLHPGDYVISGAHLPEVNVPKLFRLLK